MDDVPQTADEDLTAAETRSLLESPGASIAHSDLGRFVVQLLLEMDG